MFGYEREAGEKHMSEALYFALFNRTMTLAGT
jgi:hypothetical protein